MLQPAAVERLLSVASQILTARRCRKFVTMADDALDSRQTVVSEICDAADWPAVTYTDISIMALAC